MEQEKIINGFAKLGELMVSLGEKSDWSGFELGVTEEEYAEIQFLIERQISFNGWFTAHNVRNSLRAIGLNLNKIDLTKWSKEYNYATTPKSVGLIMAGNIPLVGFHDFLCVIISGNKASCKLSSDDKSLLPILAKHLVEFVPELSERISFSTGRIGEIDAVIATGSDNSLKYFKQYFGKYPHIFRKNRTSVAVFGGSEIKEDIERLGSDIFSYFGLGCRNVSHLLFPKDFEISRFFEGIFRYSDVINNNKYGNNYDYNKAIFLMNKHALLDNNFVLLRESTELFSPLAMLHYHFYASDAELKPYLEEHAESIQVVVGENYYPFGKAQSPGLSDYADGVDVMRWLETI